MGQHYHRFARPKTVSGWHDPEGTDSLPARPKNRHPMATHTLISSVKDEGPFLLEWVAHHRVLGFDAIYIASNDCTDGTDRLLAALDHAGFIGHVPNLLQPGDVPQHAGYDKIRSAHPIDRSDWLMMLDADEFLNIHVGAHQVQDLTTRAEAADIISLCGRTFSDLPQTQWQPGPVTRLFPNALRPIHKANQAIKTLTRDPSRFKGIHNHHMVGYRGGKVPLSIYHAQNDCHSDLPDNARIGDTLRHIPKEAIGHKVAQYNHYAVKTLDSFLLRRKRGRGVAVVNAETADRHTLDYFTHRSGRGTPELSVQRYAPQTDRLIAEMLEEPAIAAAHQACLFAYAAAIAALDGENAG
jgi:hypothetical protein